MIPQLFIFFYYYSSSRVQQKRRTDLFSAIFSDQCAKEFEEMLHEKGVRQGVRKSARRAREFLPTVREKRVTKRAKKSAEQCIIR